MYGKLVEREKRSSRVLTCGAFADIFIDAYHRFFAIESLSMMMDSFSFPVATCSYSNGV